MYVFLTSEGEVLYVGHSISLYNRIISYFMPSILKTKARRVLRYFNKHGFTNVVLHVYIMKNPASLEQVIELEQSLIDTLKPILNVDLVAKGTGYHEPMRLEMREQPPPFTARTHACVPALRAFSTHARLRAYLGTLCLWHARTLACVLRHSVPLPLFFFIPAGIDGRLIVPPLSG